MSRPKKIKIGALYSTQESRVISNDWFLNTKVSPESYGSITPGEPFVILKYESFGESAWVKILTSQGISGWIISSISHLFLAKKTS